MPHAPPRPARCRSDGPPSRAPDAAAASGGGLSRRALLACAGGLTLPAAATGWAGASVSSPVSPDLWVRLRQQGTAQDPTARARLDDLAALAGQSHLWPVPQRVWAVHRFINTRIAFATDNDRHGQPDHWASPLDTLVAGQGDCEDYAVAKYFILRACGIEAPTLRLVYARLQGPSGSPHMVLAWQADRHAVVRILDNLDDGWPPLTRRPDLHAVFSFNALGLWQGLGDHSLGDPFVRLPAWSAVWTRAAQEGFVGP